MQRTLFITLVLASCITAQADPIADRDAARAHYDAGAWGAAADAYAPLTAVNPDDGALAYFLGVSLSRSGQCGRAISELERALSLGAAGGRGSLSRAHVELAACSAQEGDTATALAHLTTANTRLGFIDFASVAEDDRFASIVNDPQFGRLRGDRPSISDRDSGWREDLSTYVALLERRHPNPFHAISETEWRHSVEVLRADIPRLQDFQIVGRFMQLSALIGDGHTTVIPMLEGPSAFHLLPIWPYAFGDDWYILAAAPEQRDLVGARIVAVDGAPIADVSAALQSMLARDNSMTGRWTGSVALQFAEMVAFAAGSEYGAVITLELETASGERRVATLTGGPIDRDPTARWSPEHWPTMADAAPRPLWLQHLTVPFWLDSRRDGVVYAQINQISDGDDVTFEQMCADLGRRLRARGVRALVLDLRHNNGGSGALNWSLVREIVRAPNVDRPDGLYVIVGRRTFSAAMNLASMLETHTNAIFVGEASGSRPNFYGEDTPFTLPYSGLSGSISSAWFQGGLTSDDQRPWIPPDLPAPLAPEDVATGRDPALAAIEARLAE